MYFATINIMLICCVSVPGFAEPEQFVQKEANVCRYVFVVPREVTTSRHIQLWMKVRSCIYQSCPKTLPIVRRTAGFYSIPRWSYGNQLNCLKVTKDPVLCNLL